jgi:hypothetical protein
LKTKFEKGKKKYFVCWRGYPSSFYSWISGKDFDKDYFKLVSMLRYPVTPLKMSFQTTL